MMSAKRIFLLLFISACIGLNGQYTKEFKRIFFDADYLYETGFYEEAFSRYKNLLTLDPGNSNILFRCGASSLKIPGGEVEAITYLKDAVSGVSLSYKEGSHKESGAPVLTYFMLGQAYHQNYMFDEAIENYTKYLEIGEHQVPMQLDYTRLQIEACKVASELERTRPSFEFQSVLDHFDDDLPSCSNPVVSGNGDVLVFLVDYPADKKIMMSTKTGELWSRPTVINSQLGMVGETYPASLSYDGDELYLVHHYYSHSDIFVSRFQGNRWTEAEALGYNINGRTSENHASISKDGKSLYFTSDVRGGSGSFDIYVSRLDEKGNWGEAVNLGPTINTPFEEHTPFISNNDSVLFFSSQGHPSLGGLDVFYSVLNSYGVWSEPENMGYPVNTTGDDVFFNPGWNEIEGYYAVPRKEDPTSNTINIVLQLEYEDELATSSLGDSISVKPKARLAVTKPAVAPMDDATVASTDSVQAVASDPVVAIPPTVEMAIEPEETDEIEEVLNRDARQPEPEPAEPVEVATVPVTVSSPEAPSMLVTAVPFDLNEYHLNMAGLLEVEKIADLMSGHPETQVELTGHTDASGTAQYNMLLSRKRSGQIAIYLERKGVDRKRILVNGKGETSPLAKEKNADGSEAPLGRYLNRQVYVTIAGSVPVVSELSGVYIPEDLRISDKSGHAKTATTFVYTIQVSAAHTPISISRFEKVGPATEYKCKDGYYRYAVGSYETFQEATQELRTVRNSEFDDAFIQTLDWYERAMK
jgi:outer membrane protein OmpA-like peptidoglycan-associated protein/tetratricopeptide (TPR) repeat protein